MNNMMNLDVFLKQQSVDWQIMISKCATVNRLCNVLFVNNEMNIYLENAPRPKVM